MTGNDIHIGKLQLKEDNGLYTVTALVDGAPLWFESADHPLRIAPEAIAGTLLLPAMLKGRNLVFEDPLCPVWLENARQIMDFHHDWWGWSPVEIRSSHQEQPVRHEGNKTALCFSGGVDSFHSITTYPEPIDYIVTVHGYDIRLSDAAGGKHALDNIREVADTYNVKHIAFRTNLRDHHLAGRRYHYSFEGALAAIGYLLADVKAHIISSDYSRDAIQRYHIKTGSHWYTGPLRSSADIKIIHFGEAFTRDEKLRQIAHIPLLRTHLRICQENLGSDFNLGGQYLNCGKCCKCMRTLIPLLQTTGLDEFKCFANKEHIDDCINEIETSADYACITYEGFIAIGVSPVLERSIRALIWRSRFLNKRPWLGRKGKKILARLFMSWRDLKQRLSGE